MSANAGGKQRLRILMVSDFFYPNFGGVETHIYQLSQCLMEMGHYVVIMTHAYGARTGVRYLTNGLKVYYVPRRPFYANATLPTIFGNFRLLRCILLREGIHLVHAHQAFSTLGNEAILHARTLGLPAVFTDHSLFGFADAASICTNKVLKWTLADVQAVICVSHTSKENTVLRACVPPSQVHVIPNAVDTSKFAPFPRPRFRNGRLRVIGLNRLVYRKGIDLQAAIIPVLCKRFPNVDFVIGGDGPKRDVLESMVARHRLHSRVQLIGAVQHEAARELLVSGAEINLEDAGDVFLNTSLTEAFCMAIVEAAATGLLVVSTDVGGVPEVLPDTMCILARPDPAGLLHAMEEAIKRVRRCPVDRQQQHNKVAEMYSWPSVAQRTLRPYALAMASPHSGALCTRIEALAAVGPCFGLIVIVLAALDMLVLCFIQACDPAHGIDKVVLRDRRPCQTMNTPAAHQGTAPSACKTTLSTGHNLFEQPGHGA